MIAVAVAAMSHREWNTFVELSLHVLVATNVFMLVCNLGPWNIWVGAAKHPSDGLQMLTLPWMSRQRIDNWHASWFYLEGLESRERGRADEAEQWHAQGIAAYPGEWANYNGLGILLLDLKRNAEAKDCFVNALDQSTLQPAEEAILWNNIAWSKLMIGDPELVTEADELSKQAFECLPWYAPVKGTRGSVLIERGQYDAGLELLRAALLDNEEATSKAINACYMALAMLRQGNPAEAEQHLEQARRLDAKCPLIERVEAELAGQPLPI